MKKNNELNKSIEIDYKKKLKAENSISYNFGIQYYVIRSKSIDFNFFRNSIKIV